MTTVWLILAMAAAVFALRLTGFLLADVAIPPAWERALGFLPVAVLTALVVSSLDGGGENGAARLIAAAGAGVIAYLSRRMWACILGGLAVYWLLRLV